MNKRLLFLIILIPFLYNNSRLLGQVVNIEKKRKGDRDGFAGVIGASFYMIDNGKKILQFKSVIDLQYDHGPHTFLILNDLNLMRVESGKSGQFWF